MLKSLLLMMLISCSASIPDSGIIHVKCAARNYDVCTEILIKRCGGAAHIITYADDDYVYGQCSKE